MNILITAEVRRTGDAPRGASLPQPPKRARNQLQPTSMSHLGNRLKPARFNALTQFRLPSSRFLAPDERTLRHGLGLRPSRGQSVWSAVSPTPPRATPGFALHLNFDRIFRLHISTHLFHLFFFFLFSFWIFNPWWMSFFSSNPWRMSWPFFSSQLSLTTY